MNERDPAMLEAINLRFAISKVFLAADDCSSRWHTSASTASTASSAGSPSRSRSIEGRGEVKLERFGDEEIALRAAPGAHGKLRLNVSYFSRWRAYRDGQARADHDHLSARGPGHHGLHDGRAEPGHYRFVFTPTLGDRMAVPLGSVGMLLCGVFALSDRRVRGTRWLRRVFDALAARLDRLSEPAWHRRRLLLLWLLCASLLALGVGLALVASALEPQELGPMRVRRVRYDFLEQLSQASADIAYPSARQPCLQQGDRLVCRDAEGNLDNERYVASNPATIKEYDDGALHPRAPGERRGARACPSPTCRWATRSSATTASSAPAV